MGRHRSRSRSKSNDRRKNRGHRDGGDRDRDNRDRRDRRSRSRDRRSRSPDRRERRSKFDDPSAAGGFGGPRKSKWSDQPPDASQAIYDPNAAKLAAQNLINAITINPEAQHAQNELREKQAELFGNMLKGARFEADPNARVETIRPSNQQVDTKNLKQDYAHAAGIINTLSDNTKIKRKIYIPKDTNFNYTGLIIGPKGANQKRLEEETGCKVLVRGKGSQREGQPPQPDDHEDQHVLIVGDNEFQMAKATAEIERILFADEETRTKIKQEQLRLVAQLKNDPTILQAKGLNLPNGDADLSMTTPYGPPSSDAFVIKVPNDCVGLVIGKNGETIRNLQMQSGAKKVQVATDSNKGATYRNLFVEGDREAYERVQAMVREIVEQQQKLKQAMTGVMPDNSQANREEVPVPNDLVGLLIGKGGETIRSINQRTGAVVFIPKECEQGKNERILVVTGRADQVEQAKQEIMEKVNEGIRNQQLKALHASGIPIQLMNQLGYGDPHLVQQYLASFDPQYAAMYQQMYAQQPEVTTVTDASSLPGQQAGYYGHYQQQQQQQQQQQMPAYNLPPEYMAQLQQQFANQGQGQQGQGQFQQPPTYMNQ